MNKLPDGNASALRAHEASQDRADAKREAYGARAREAIVDDLMNKRSVGNHKIMLQDILDSHDELLSVWEIQNLATRNPELVDMVLRDLEKRCIELCADWLETVAGQDAVDDLVNEMDEDARSEK